MKSKIHIQRLFTHTKSQKLIYARLSKEILLCDPLNKRSRKDTTFTRSHAEDIIIEKRDQDDSIHIIKIHFFHFADLQPSAILAGFYIHLRSITPSTRISLLKPLMSVVYNKVVKVILSVYSIFYDK